MTNEFEERRKKRKARKTRRRFLSFLGFVLLLVYIPALWNWFFSVNYEIASISMSTLEIKSPVNGLIIRKETPVKSPGSGILIPSIQFGERVGKGNEIVSFVKSDMKDIVENYRRMEVEILKRVVSEFDSTSGAERQIWENAIETQIAKLTEITNTGDLSDAHSIRNTVDKILEAKARYMLEDQTITLKMGKEKEELDRLRSSIKNSVISVYAPISGIVSYYCDGFEGIYTPENRSSVSIENIDEAIKSEVNGINWLTPAEINVVNDENFCKIIANDKAWMVFYLPEEQGKKLKVEFEKAKLDGLIIQYDMEIEGVDQRIPLTIESIGDENDGMVKIIGSFTKYIEKVMNIRGFKGNLLLQNVTGMRVPI
ncbi:MAG: hypothetical protein GX957_09925, partial [Clostridiaceae bacterium]|nr:hypothetical protein [Clostridiaceae bacterium]